MSTLVAASPELKRLWIRVLKRVHPDLAVDEQDRRRCERLTQQANDAYARRDELALRAVLGPKGPPPSRHAPPDPWAARPQDSDETPLQSTYQAPLAPQQPSVSGREVFGILCAAGAVVCLLLYGIFYALSEQVGRKTSLSFLALLTIAVLWLITRHSKLSYEHKARWVLAVASGTILVAVCLLDSRPRANSLVPSARAATAQALGATAGLKDSGDASPSQWYWNVIKTRVGQSWNPSAVVDTPADATAEVTFTISHDGSPRDAKLRRSSGYPSLDSSCVLAVQQVRTFGPPEGGAKDSLNVLYPCSYSELTSMNAHPPQRDIPQEKATVTPPRPDSVESPVAQLGAYIEAAKNKVAKKWDASEIAGSIPAGATVYIQFAIRRRGNHEAPTMETSSGYSSLDVSCLGAVNQIQTFDQLPRSYSGNSLTVVYHCTYPGSPTTKLAQDSILPAVQQAPPSGPVDDVHDAQKPASDSVVNN